VGERMSRLSVDRRGDLGTDMMAAESVGGALVAEAWAETTAQLLSHPARGGCMYVYVCLCVGGELRQQNKQVQSCRVFGSEASGPHQPKAPRFRW
jgi:hypothetical protein